jgi:hypothetical protein
LAACVDLTPPWSTTPSNGGAVLQDVADATPPTEAAANDGGFGSARDGRAPDASTLSEAGGRSRIWAIPLPPALIRPMQRTISFRTRQLAVRRTRTLLGSSNSGDWGCFYEFLVWGN